MDKKWLVATCYSQEERELIIQNITAYVQNTILQNLSLIEFTLNCGFGQWYRVASLNMSDPSQQCPSAWREYNTSGVRDCGRPPTADSSCPGVFQGYATNRQYSRVCGRAIGYQIGSTDAFGYQALEQPIDSYYVYGVSITHGSPCNHIWTYAAGVSEGQYRYQRDNCPCSNPSHPDNAYPPSFVGITTTVNLTIQQIHLTIITFHWRSTLRWWAVWRWVLQQWKISSIVQCGVTQPNNWRYWGVYLQWGG